MSSKSSGNTTARHDIVQYLGNNSGWHEVADIANAVGYSHNHALSTGKQLARDEATGVEGRKNHSKPVVGYYINGSLEVPGSNRQEVVRLIRVHSDSHPSLEGMSMDELYKCLRNVASGTVTLEYKREFRIR
ncbi:hypothetical protein GCM10009060_25190 [Halorubrum trapanicum]